MKTLKSKFVWAIGGFVKGAIFGYLIGAFIAGTLDPFSIRMMNFDYMHYVYTDVRNFGLEGLARLGWLILIVGSGAGVSSLAYYIGKNP